MSEADEEHGGVCIRRPVKGLDHLTYCGREPDTFEFTYEGPDHAIEDGMNKSGRSVCPKCRKVMFDAIGDE